MITDVDLHYLSADGSWARNGRASVIPPHAAPTVRLASARVALPAAPPRVRLASVRVAAVAVAPPASPKVRIARAVVMGEAPGWNLIFDEHFPDDVAEGSFLTSYGSRWHAYSENAPDTYGQNPTNYKGPSSDLRRSVYRTTNISVAGGVMSMRLFVDTDGICVGAVPQPRWPGIASTSFSSAQTYFRYRFTMRCLSPVQGWKVAWLLWPDSNSWVAEDDWPEGNLISTFGGFHHHYNDVNTKDSYSSGLPFTSWHTFEAQWTPGKLVWLLDNQVVKTMAGGVASVPLHGPIFQTETVLSGSGRPVAGETCTVQVKDVSIWIPA